MKPWKLLAIVVGGSLLLFYAYSVISWRLDKADRWEHVREACEQTCTPHVSKVMTGPDGWLHGDDFACFCLDDEGRWVPQ